GGEVSGKGGVGLGSGGRRAGGWGGARGPDRAGGPAGGPPRRGGRAPPPLAWCRARQPRRCAAPPPRLRPAPVRRRFRRYNRSKRFSARLPAMSALFSRALSTRRKRPPPDRRARKRPSRARMSARHAAGSTGSESSRRGLDLRTSGSSQLNSSLSLPLICGGSKMEDRLRFDDAILNPESSFFDLPLFTAPPRLRPSADARPPASPVFRSRRRFRLPRDRRPQGLCV